MDEGICFSSPVVVFVDAFLVHVQDEERVGKADYDPNDDGSKVDVSLNRVVDQSIVERRLLEKTQELDNLYPHQPGCNR